MLKKGEFLDDAFIIAEVGQNHQGELGLAKQYIKEFSHLGADAIKFQTRDNKFLFSEGLIEGYFLSNVISSRCSLLLSSKEQIGNKSIKVEVPIEWSIDINTDFDLFIAEKVAEKIGLCCFSH